MTAVVGVDVSLTSTGVVVIRDDGHANLHTIATIGKRGDDLTLRGARLRAIGEEVRSHFADAAWHHGLALVVIEGPSMGSVGGSSWDRAGLWWSLVQSAFSFRAPVAVVAPTTRAKWAAGSGKADKAAVAAAVTRRAPDIIIVNSDQADALALAWMGAQHLGWKPATKAERESLDVVKWPPLISDD